MKYARCLIISLLPALFSLPLEAQNPTVSYSTPKTYIAGTAIPALTPTSSGVAKLANSTTSIVLGTGLSSPKGIAIDSKGNLYVADYGNNAIKEIPFATNNTIAIGSGFSHPTDVKVDAAGNIYIADSGNNAVKEIKAGGGAIVTLGSGFNDPAGLALDPAGNVYVADENNNAIKKIPAGGGAPVTLAGGFNKPAGVAVDVSGNVYVTDVNNALYKIPVTGGSIITVATGFNNPNGLTIDASGNIVIADSGHGVITIIPANGNPKLNVKYAFGNPFGVAVDNKNNLFVTDDNNDALDELVPLGGYSINKALPAGLVFSNGTGVITGTPAFSSPATIYTISAYNATGSGSANLTITVNLPPLPAISYASPQTYNVATAIPALSPASTGVAAGGYNIRTTTIGSGFAGPSGVAVDNKGDVFVADPNNNLIKEIPAGNGTPVVLGAGFSAPASVAVDAAGDAFVADFGNNAIKKIPASNGAPVLWGSGFLHPYGVAVDAAGNVYVSDQGNNQVKKIPAGNGTPVVLASGLNLPGGISVDAAGNVYFADMGNNEVKEIPAAGGAPIVIGAGFNQPVSVVSDINGNIYVADRNNNAVKEIVAGTGTTVTIGSGFNTPYGVAVDGKGNVFVGDYGNNMVKKISPAGGYYFSSAPPAGLHFSNTAGTISGTPTAVSAAKNYVVTVYSGGGSASATVSITVNAALNNATLSKLVFSSGTLTPSFAPATIKYTASVANTLSSITITPTAANPHATIKINGVAVASGAVSQSLPLKVGPNVISAVVTAQDGATTKTYTLTVTRAASANDNLSSLKPGRGALSPAFSPATLSYTLSVVNTVTSLTLTPTAKDTTATIKVKGTIVKSGTASGAIALTVGSNTIATVVTAQDGTTTKTYTLTVTRAASANDNLSWLKLSTGVLSPAFTPATLSYTSGVANGVTSLTITPTANDTTATIKVKGTTVRSGVASVAIALAVGVNTITTVVTAGNGTAIKTYTVKITRSPSANANLASINPSITPLSPTFTPATTSYALSVKNTVTSMTVKPVTTDGNATVKVNGTAVASGTVSPPIELAVGPNTITATVTAQDGATTKTYTITVTRAASGADSYDPGISVNRPTETPALAEDGVVIHQGISPNGDGLNDVLQIDNISQYPENKLSIMNRNGQLVYEAKGYDNTAKAFDGHSNKNGQMQLPGTYFYQLDYAINGTTKHKTGFIVLKY